MTGHETQRQEQAVPRADHKYVQWRVSQRKQQEVDLFFNRPKVNPAAQMHTHKTCLHTRSLATSSLSLCVFLNRVMMYS